MTEVYGTTPGVRYWQKAITRLRSTRGSACVNTVRVVKTRVVLTLEPDRSPIIPTSDILVTEISSVLVLVSLWTRMRL